MSVIKTAETAGVNPFEYLIDVQRYKARVFKDPVAWLPWNYRATLEGLVGEPDDAAEVGESGDFLADTPTGTEITTDLIAPDVDEEVA